MPVDLATYIDIALRNAVFKPIEDDQVFGEVPALPGVWATAPTKEACFKELADVIQGWVELRRNLKLEVPQLEVRLA